MKNWNNLDGSIFFNKVFSRPIEVGKAYIHSLRIENDLNDFGIGFDIPDFPDRLHEKWKDKGRKKKSLPYLNINKPHCA